MEDCSCCYLLRYPDKPAFSQMYLKIHLCGIIVLCCPRISASLSENRCRKGNVLSACIESNCMCVLYGPIKLHHAMAQWDLRAEFSLYAMVVGGCTRIHSNWWELTKHISSNNKRIGRGSLFLASMHDNKCMVPIVTILMEYQLSCSNSTIRV